LLQNNYTTLIDVGCAEGYYAVGLAIISPKLNVYAYDIDEVARKSCSRMAELNGVSDRVHIREWCTTETLQNFHHTGKTLIICDCEGYEAELFDVNIAQVLLKHDLIIELHDNVIPNIKTHISDAFSKTHDVSFVSSKLKSAKDYPLMLQLPNEYIQDRYLIERGTRMEWAVITSKV
jgi:Ribosomal protein L11 methylase